VENNGIYVESVMRLIIENKSSRPDATALEYALKVIRKGKTQHSAQGWIYQRAMFESGIVVECSKNKNSDRIVVREQL